MVALILGRSTWLSIKASRTGTGKDHSREYRLKSTVLRMVVKALNELKNRSNCWNPTQGLPEKPSDGL